MIDMICMIGG